MAMLAAPLCAQSVTSPAASPALVRERMVDGMIDQTAEAKALPAATRAALFQAAGMERLADGRWTRCTDDDTGGSQGLVALYQDLNGDGRPEAVVRDEGIFCNGHAGTSSIVLSQRTDGSWATLYRNQGYVSFLASRGQDDYPDIEAGLPGLCFPYFRWNGQTYQLIAKLDNDGQACDPN